jgi:hypothetical protein
MTVRNFMVVPIYIPIIRIIKLMSVMLCAGCIHSSKSYPAEAFLAQLFKGITGCSSLFWQLV